MKRGALIGCGFFSQNHLQAWRQLPGAEIIALCDRDEQRLTTTARDFGIVRTYRNAAELFAHEQLDFVDIATTAPSHRALVEMAAAAGVPCICQKPFAPSMADAKAMVDVCAHADVALMVHENFRWQTPIQAARRLLDEGAIGRPFWAASPSARRSTSTARSPTSLRASASLSRTWASTSSTSPAS